MSLVGFKAENHVQQVTKRGAKDDTDDRGTEQSFVDAVAERLGMAFTIDVAAAAHNTKCERFYSREDDGLAQSWAGETVWCNPPYSNLGAWLSKAWSEFDVHRWIKVPDGSNMTGGRPFSFCSQCDLEVWEDGTVRPGVQDICRGADAIVMLLPANRVEQSWWQDFVEPFRDRPGSPLTVEFLRGRMRFDRPNSTIGPKGDRPPFGCCLLIWMPAVSL